MALRHRFAYKALPDFRQESEPSQSPAVMRPPRTVDFRPESNLDTIAEEITRYARVTLSAAPGAGKSTRVPIKLAQVVGLPVLLAVPSEHLADQHYKFLVKKFPNDFSVALEETDVVAPQGVTVTSYAWLTGRILQARGQGKEHKPFGDCVIYADEVHESDAFSEFVRRLGTNIPGVRHFVMASATHDAARMPRLEARGSVETKFFSRKEPPNTWDPADPNKPWSVATFTGNVLIFLDDDKAATNLVTKYAVMGVSAYRMSSRMKRSDAQAAFDELSDPSGGLVVMVADYSFRNGFTYDITRIIDSALVKVVTVDKGEMKKSFRTVYEIEKYQSMARGGRTDGSSCEYYIPEDMTFKSAICSLDGIEAEAAAVMYRACGYAVPSDVAACTVSSPSKIPRNLYDAFTGFVPLAMLSEADLIDLVMPKLAPVNTSVDAVLDSYGIDASPVVHTSDLFDGLDVSVPTPKSTVVTTDLLLQLQQLSSSSRTLVPGYYYSCESARPNGSMGYATWESIAEAVHANKLVVTGYSREMREDAVHKLLLQYNQFIVLESAATRVGAQSEALAELVRVYPQEVKIWAKWLADKLQHSKAMSASILTAVSHIRTPEMVFREVEPDVDLEERQAQEMVAPLKQAVASAAKPVNTKTFFAEVGGQLGYDPGPSFPAIERPVVEAIGDGSSKCHVRWKIVSMAGRVMHDMTVIPEDPIRWTKEDYVAAVSDMVTQKGVVPEAIRQLHINAPGIDPGVVMQAVRDQISLGQQKPKSYTVTRVKKAIKSAKFDH